jgi:hypothetical protein
VEEDVSSKSSGSSLNAASASLTQDSKSDALEYPSIPIALEEEDVEDGKSQSAARVLPETEYSRKKPRPARGWRDGDKEAESISNMSDAFFFWPVVALSEDAPEEGFEASEEEEEEDCCDIPERKKDEDDDDDDDNDDEDDDA